MPAQKFTAMVGAGIEGHNVKILVNDAAGQSHELHFAEGMAGGMVLALIDQLRLLQESERQAETTFGQATELTDVRGFSLPDGRRGLALTFEHAMRVMSILSSDMRRHFRRELETLERLSTAEPKTRRDGH